MNIAIAKQKQKSQLSPSERACNCFTTQFDRQYYTNTSIKYTTHNIRINVIWLMDYVLPFTTKVFINLRYVTLITYHRCD